MRAPPMAGVRLERAFAFHDSLLQENDHIIGGFPKVSTKAGRSGPFVLESASFTKLSKTSQKDMGVWSLTKVFHTCGKNCGNWTLEGRKFSKSQTLA